MGKSTISMAIFHSYVRHNQRVCFLCHWTWHKMIQNDYRTPGPRPSSCAAAAQPLSCLCRTNLRNGGKNGLWQTHIAIENARLVGWLIQWKLWFSTFFWNLPVPGNLCLGKCHPRILFDNVCWNLSTALQDQSCETIRSNYGSNKKTGISVKDCIPNKHPNHITLFRCTQ